MPKPSNPLFSIAKKLEALKSKSDKLAQEIADLSAAVSTEASKAQVTTPTPAAKKPVDKKASTTGEPKKRGRPAKVKVAAKPNYLSMLNDETASETPTKKRGKK
jgi:hypothetical protein